VTPDGEGEQRKGGVAPEHESLSIRPGSEAHFECLRQMGRDRHRLQRRHGQRPEAIGMKSDRQQTW